MSKCPALYSRTARPHAARALVAFEWDVLHITLPNGCSRRIALNGARYRVRDAACRSRFVRHLALRWAEEAHDDARVDLITPPDEGAIAPRVARLPGVPEDVAIVSVQAWETVVDWIQGGGGLGGRTVAELARLARFCTPSFAIALGERAAEVACTMVWERNGPMRGGGDVRDTLRPLKEAAITCPRAAEALVAALSHTRGVLAPTQPPER